MLAVLGTVARVLLASRLLSAGVFAISAASGGATRPAWRATVTTTASRSTTTMARTTADAAKPPPRDGT